MKYTFLLFSFAVLSTLHSQAQIDTTLNDLLAPSLTQITEETDFAKAGFGYTITISGTDASTKPQVTLKDKDGKNVPQLAEVPEQQVIFDVRSYLKGDGPVNFVLSPDGKKQIAITIIHKKDGTQDTGGSGGSTKAGINEFDNAIKRAFGLKLASSQIRYDRKRNICYEGNLIHLFLDEKGNFYISGPPTTAREDNVFMLHVFYKEDAEFKLEYEGVFQPAFEVYGVTANKGAQGNAASSQIKQIDFGAVGPFTGTAKFTVTRTVGGKPKVILDKVIQIAKLHKITLTAGLYGSFLRSPENITTFVKPNGDTTLTADNPTTRSFVTVMLAFYPWPRNILIPSHDWKERISLSVGTSINKNLSENFFAGLNYDIAMGLALSAGGHYGSRQYVIGYKNFNYGEDKFSGSLENRVKKEYNINWFIGLSVDFRLLGYIFQNPTGAATP